MIKLKAFLLLLSILSSMSIKAQVYIESENEVNGVFEYFEAMSNNMSDDKAIYIKTLKDVVRMPKSEDKVTAFLNRMEIDTSTVYIKFDALDNLYSYATALLEMNTRFLNLNKQEVGRIKMMKNLVAHDYDSICGFSLYYFEEVRQLPTKEEMLFCDKYIQIYKSSQALYQADKEGLIEIALSCLKHGLGFPFFGEKDGYSSVNFSEYGWFRDDECILSFYEHIYKKSENIKDENWELLSPFEVLLYQVSNPFLSEETFKALVNMMTDSEKNRFPQVVLGLNQAYAKNEVSYSFLLMLFDHFPIFSKGIGCNKLHLLVLNFDVARIQDLLESKDSILLLEASTPRDWSEPYSENPISEPFTPLQLAEYKLSEFEKALAEEKKQTKKSKYNDNELFYTFRVEQMRKVVSILKSKL